MEMKKLFCTLFAVVFCLLLAVPCLAAEFTGENAYGETQLSVADDGSYTYAFSNETHGFSVNLIASGTVSDEDVTIDLITNPDMGDLDVTALWDQALIKAEIMTIYTGEPHSAAEFASEEETSGEPDAATVPEAAPADSGPTPAAPEGPVFDPVILEPISEVIAGTYTGSNDYGPVTLELSPNGAFTYSFNNSAFGNIVSMVATGSVVDGEFVAEQILNPTMGNFDATSTYNLTEFGYQVKSIYLGRDWNTEQYQIYLENSIDPAEVERIENSRIPTLIVTVILLVAILVVTTLTVYFKYKKRWPSKETVVEAAAPVAEQKPGYDKHQVVEATLYGDTIPVTIAADEAESRFSIRYVVMGNELSAEGEIQDGNYVLGRESSPMVKNMLGLATPLLTENWLPGDGQ